MRQTDVAIIGGGLAGATAAATLGRAGIDAVVIDPHRIYPPDFRAEKLDGSQVAILMKTGIGEAVLRETAHSEALWVAHFGHLVDKKPHGDQYGIIYDHLVNTVRAQIPEHVPFIEAKVAGIATSADRQTVKLSTGEEISARLLVMATGLNLSLRHLLGLDRVVTDTCHSITIGFDVKPVGRAAFPFPALTYYSAGAADRFAYLTLFPTKTAMRVNFLVYRDLSDPWLTKFRADPVATMLEAMPGLARIAGAFEVVGPLRIRPADLYVTRGHEQPGVVLVGDAFGTSCPAAGTGTGKAFNDVERLCNVHIPEWLASPGMGTAKIAAFYTDPEKQAYDAWSIAKARRLRSISVDPGLRWSAFRWARFGVNVAKGISHQMRSAVPRSAVPQTEHFGELGKPALKN